MLPILNVIDPVETGSCRRFYLRQLGFFQRGARSGASVRDMQGVPLVIFGSEPISEVMASKQPQRSHMTSKLKYTASKTIAYCLAFNISMNTFRYRRRMGPLSFYQMQHLQPPDFRHETQQSFAVHQLGATWNRRTDSPPFPPTENRFSRP